MRIDILPDVTQISVGVATCLLALLTVKVGCGELLYRPFGEMVTRSRPGEIPPYSGHRIQTF